MSRASQISWFLLATSLPLVAETNALPTLAPAPTISASLAVVRVLGALGLVIAIFLGGVWLFRHWQTLLVRKGRPRQLAVLEVCSLGNRQALYLVKCSRQRFLISGAANGVSLLSELPAVEGGEETETGNTPSRTFAEKLQVALNRS